MRRILSRDGDERRGILDGVVDRSPDTPDRCLASIAAGPAHGLRPRLYLYAGQDFYAVQLRAARCVRMALHTWRHRTVPACIAGRSLPVVHCRSSSVASCGSVELPSAAWCLIAALVTPRAGFCVGARIWDRGCAKSPRHRGKSETVRFANLLTGMRTASRRPRNVMADLSSARRNCASVG